MKKETQLNILVGVIGILVGVIGILVGLLSKHFASDWACYIAAIQGYRFGGVVGIVIGSHKDDNTKDD